MKYNQRNPHQEDPTDTQRSDGWMILIVCDLLRSTAAIACIMVMLWMAKCPGGLEWWRVAGIGFIIPVISRLL
jgi:hypothetical protein